MAPWIVRFLAPLAFLALQVPGASAQAPAGDVPRIVSRLRAEGGACAANAPPVRQRGALDAAAARIADGQDISAALKASAYRATQAQVIAASGGDLAAQLETLLGRRFCAQIGNADLSEIGVHGRRGRIWIVLAAPFAPRVDLTRGQVEQRMLALVNQARSNARRCGTQAFAAAPAVSWSAALEAAATRHAVDMAGHDYFSHTGRDGTTPAQRVVQAGYRYRMTGENIAAGQRSPEDAVAGWINSPPHCANLMQPAYTHMGVAFAVDAASSLGIYWAQEFGTPR